VEPTRCSVVISRGLQSDENGMFEITTVYPGYYQGENSPPPAHIHVSIQLPGSDTGGRAIDTEIVFTGDPHIPPNAGSPNFTIVALEKIQDAGVETWVGVADIVLDIDPPVEPSDNSILKPEMLLSNFTDPLKIDRTRR
jgi:protocatechuate 3,4-dioxygenase beta subunit